MALVGKIEEINPTRRSLLVRLKDWQDDQSWQQFFDSYWRLVYSVGIKAGLSETEAQEVVQETFITVAKKMPEFNYDPEKGRFRNWLIHTTQWRVYDQLEKRKRFPNAMEFASADDETSAIERIPQDQRIELDRICDEEWARNLFHVAVEKVKHKVSARQFQIFELCVVKECPVRKIMQLLGISREAIYTAKHRVSQAVEKELAALKEKTL